MMCPDCAQALPDGAGVCPGCAATRRLARLRSVNGALKGGAAGLALGLVILTVLLGQPDLLASAWGLTLLPIILFALGAAIGFRRASSSGN